MPEVSGQLGTSGVTGDAKLSGGILSVSMSVDLAAQVAALAAKVTNATEKALLMEASVLIKGIV